jgi:hypothetical protein
MITRRRQLHDHQCLCLPSDGVTAQAPICAASYPLHAQCPSRVVRGAQIVVGSGDVTMPRSAGGPECRVRHVRHDVHRTAKILTEWFAAGEYSVIEAEMLENGEIIIEITESVRFEVFPMCSGPVESWRLFEKGSDVRYVYRALRLSGVGRPRIWRSCRVGGVRRRAGNKRVTSETRPERLARPRVPGRPGTCRGRTRSARSPSQR